MAENSHIEWTTHTFNPWSLLSVYGLMARQAKRQAITYIKPQFWVIGPRFDMMRPKNTAPVITAMLADKLVAGEHVVTPPLVFRGEALAAPLRQQAIFVRVTGGAAPDLARPSEARADLGALFGCSRDTLKRGWFALAGFAHRCLCFLGVPVVFECRHAPFVALRGFDPGAVEALCGKAVMPALVPRKGCAGILPLLADDTTLLPALRLGKVIAESETRFLRGDFERPLFGLCHCVQP